MAHFILVLEEFDEVVARGWLKVGRIDVAGTLISQRVSRS